MNKSDRKKFENANNLFYGKIIGNCESCGKDIRKREKYHELASISQYYKNKKELYCEMCFNM